MPPEWTPRPGERAARRRLSRWETSAHPPKNRKLPPITAIVPQDPGVAEAGAHAIQACAAAAERHLGRGGVRVEQAAREGQFSGTGLAGHDAAFGQGGRAGGLVHGEGGVLGAFQDTRPGAAVARQPDLDLKQVKLLRPVLAPDRQAEERLVVVGGDGSAQGVADGEGARGAGGGGEVPGHAMPPGITAGGAVRSGRAVHTYGGVGAAPVDGAALADRDVLDARLRVKRDVQVGATSRPVPGEGVLLGDRDPAVRGDLRQHGGPGKAVQRIDGGRRPRGRDTREEPHGEYGNERE